MFKECSDILWFHRSERPRRKQASCFNLYSFDHLIKEVCYEFMSSMCIVEISHLLSRYNDSLLFM
jgi:hypothetical protein